MTPYKWEAYCSTNRRRIAVQMGGVLRGLPFFKACKPGKYSNTNGGGGVYCCMHKLGMYCSTFSTSCTGWVFLNVAQNPKGRVILKCYGHSNSLRWQQNTTKVRKTLRQGLWNTLVFLGKIQRKFPEIVRITTARINYYVIVFLYGRVLWEILERLWSRCGNFHPQKQKNPN